MKNSRNIPEEAFSVRRHPQNHAWWTAPRMAFCRTATGEDACSARLVQAAFSLLAVHSPAVAGFLTRPDHNRIASHRNRVAKNITRGKGGPLNLVLDALRYACCVGATEAADKISAAVANTAKQVDARKARLKIGILPRNFFRRCPRF